MKPLVLFGTADSKACVSDVLGTYSRRPNVEHNRRDAASSRRVRVDSRVGGRRTVSTDF